MSRSSAAAIYHLISPREPPAAAGAAAAPRGSETRVQALGQFDASARQFGPPHGATGPIWQR